MVGIDIVEVSRIGDVFDKYGKRFLNKVFTENEISYILGKRGFKESLAGRFAAKEAFMKAMGKRLSWRDINIVEYAGRPTIEYKGIKYKSVSISHEKAYAVSIVLMGERP